MDTSVKRGALLPNNGLERTRRVGVPAARAVIRVSPCRSTRCSRVVSAHAWARARPSGLERAYSYVGESGEKTLDLGVPSPEERALAFAFFDPTSPEAQQDSYWDREDLKYPDEEHVMALAGAWSIDPSALEGRNLETVAGLLGDYGPEVSQPPVVPKGKPWWHLW
jgi:hypothetical protein